MPINKHHKAPFTHETFYPVYNRLVSGQLLFYIDRNYVFFPEKFNSYLGGMLKVYGWCLMPDHFHFIVSVKPKHECRLSEKEKVQLNNKTFDIQDFISLRCKNFFIAYRHALKKGNILKQTSLRSITNILK
jgi:hypothetical protein